jgi:hypothetical protein
MDRMPSSKDLIIPARGGGPRRRDRALHRFAKDLGRLGLRRRRPQDLRRTFIWLARADGARPDVLERVTHGDHRVIRDSDLPWSLLCEEIAKLKIALSTGTLLRLPSTVAED